MSWEELDRKTNARFQSARPEYDEARDKLRPVIEKEEQAGAKPIAPIQFQPVRSPAIYEAEFGVKGEDIIFHFWPDKYHEAEKSNRPAPRFPKEFEKELRSSLSTVFGENRFEIHHDPDVGAIFAKAIGWGTHEFARKNAIEACSKLHFALGGE